LLQSASKQLSELQDKLTELAKESDAQVQNLSQQTALLTAENEQIQHRLRDTEIQLQSSQKQLDTLMGTDLAKQWQVAQRELQQVRQELVSAQQVAKNYWTQAKQTEAELKQQLNQCRASEKK
jgi:chromosome segregation ATPase